MKWLSHQLLVPAFLVVAIHLCEGSNTCSGLSSSFPTFQNKFGRLQQQQQQQRAKVVPSSVGAYTKAVLSGVRGGSGLAASRQLVAAATGASILTLYGLGCVLSPNKVCEDMYDLSLADQPPVMPHIVKNSGILTVTATYVLWCLAYSITSLNKAVGVAVIPYALRSLQNILTNAPEKFGVSVAIEYASLLISSVTAYATLSDAPFANTALKGLAAGMTLRGLYLWVAPNNMVAGQDKTEIDFMALMARNYGNNLIINGVFFAALAMGLNVFKSFGYAWWYAAAGMGMLVFGTKDIPRVIPTATKPTVVWVVLCAVLGTIAAS